METQKTIKLVRAKDIVEITITIKSGVLSKTEAKIKAPHTGSPTGFYLVMLPTDKCWLMAYSDDDVPVKKQISTSVIKNLWRYNKPVVRATRESEKLYPDVPAKVTYFAARSMKSKDVFSKCQALVGRDIVIKTKPTFKKV